MYIYIYIYVCVCVCVCVYIYIVLSFCFFYSSCYKSNFSIFYHLAPEFVLGKK